MDYQNPNRTCKDPNLIRTEIQKYPNETETFDPENLESGIRTPTPKNEDELKLEISWASPLSTKKNMAEVYFLKRGCFG